MDKLLMLLFTRGRKVGRNMVLKGRTGREGRRVAKECLKYKRGS